MALENIVPVFLKNFKTQEGNAPILKISNFNFSYHDAVDIPASYGVWEILGDRVDVVTHRHRY